MPCIANVPHPLRPRLALVCWWETKQKEPNEQEVGSPQIYTQRLAVLCEFCNNLEKHEFVVDENEENASLPETSIPLCKTLTDAEIQYSITWYWDYPSVVSKEDRNSAISHEWNLTIQRFQVVGIDLPEFALGDRSDYSVDIRTDEEMVQDGDENDREDEDYQTDDGCFIWSPPCEQVDIYGNTALISAAAIGNFDRMQVLLSQKVNIDTQNKEGRSALMEAAFFGRTKAVKLLLENGAATDMRDRSGLTALALAENNQFMNKKRSLFLNAGIENEVLSEEASGMDRQRQHINALLRPREMLPRNTQDQSIEHIEDIRTIHHERKSNRKKSSQNVPNESSNKAVSGTISILTSVAQINTTDVHHRTVGILHRGAPFPPVFIRSGWASQRQQGVWELHNKNWTRNVRTIGRRIGFQPAAHFRDSTGSCIWPPGTYNCSHVEKKLMAYCVLKHPNEPHRRIRCVTIQLDRFNEGVGQCKDCKKFQQIIETTFGLRFKIVLIDRESRKEPSPKPKALAELVTPQTTRLLRSQMMRVAEGNSAETWTRGSKKTNLEELFSTLQKPPQCEQLIRNMASEDTAFTATTRAGFQPPKPTPSALRVTESSFGGLSSPPPSSKRSRPMVYEDYYDEENNAMPVSPCARRRKRLQAQWKNSGNHTPRGKAQETREVKTQNETMLTFMSGGMKYTAMVYNSETVEIGFDLTDIDDSSSAQVQDEIQRVNE